MPSALTSYRWPVGAALAAVIVVAATVVAMTWQAQYQTERVARMMGGGDPAQAPDIMRRYGCAGCHTIPGIPGADGQVGGPLADIRHRVYLGGVITNAPDNLVRWIVSPQRFSPRSAMPTTGISEAEARDVVTYLYSR